MDDPEGFKTARGVALGAAMVTLGGAVLDVAPAIQQPVAVASLVVLLVLVVGWGRIPHIGRGDG
jgi:hypothetical protein